MLPTEAKSYLNDSEEPIPEFLSNGIMIHFLGDNRFLYIHKKYEPNNKQWYNRILKSKKEEDPDPNDYYVHKHKNIVHIENNSSNRKVNFQTLEDKKGLIPCTNIWVGLLRSPITPANLNLYYIGKYTSLTGTFQQFVAKYLSDLKTVIVTKTKNIANREDVLVERWYVFPDIPENQAVFIL